jgi:hypothetical protein
LEVKKCSEGVFIWTKKLHLKDVVAFYLFLCKIDDFIASTSYIFSAEVGFNTTIYQITAVCVDYVETISIVEKAKHPAFALPPSTRKGASTAAIIYTSCHSYACSLQHAHVWVWALLLER